MEIQENKYSKGKIYKIISPSNPDLVYYGSTIQKLCVRMSSHRCGIKNTCSSKNILQYDDAKIILVETYPCKSKEELISKEAEYIRNNNCVNKMIPGRTRQEYYQDNKDELKEKKQAYNEMNKEKIQKYNAEYRSSNRQYMSQLKKKYYEDRKVEISEERKDYYIANKEKIKAQKATLIDCECGVKVTSSYLSDHRKRKLHIDNLNNKHQQ